MPILNENKIKEIMRQEYKRHLFEVMNETDVVDDEGNVIIGKDLKVRHKKSQYEYTVDDVLEDPKTGDVQIALRLPSEPRIEPAPQEKEVIADTNQEPKVLGEDDLVSIGSGPGDLALPSKQEIPVPPDEDGEEEEVFFIDQEEFEKEYEVK